MSGRDWRQQRRLIGSEPGGNLIRGGIMHTRIFFFILLIFQCFSGCGSNSSGTGAVTFSVIWQGAPTLASGIDPTPQFAPLDCAASGVSTVSALAYSVSNELLASGGPWNCSDHSGTISNIPAQSNVKIVVLARNAAGDAIYRGEQPGITITAGQTTNAGTITATSFPPTLTAPADGSTVTNGSFNFSWTNTGDSYAIQVSDNSGFTSTVINQTGVTATQYTPAVALSPGTYYWRVKSRDSCGNASAWSAVWNFIVAGPNSAKAITSFSFASPAASGTIDENAKTIAVTVPYDTDVTALVATFSTTGVSVKVGTTDQISGSTPNDFTSPVLYVVTAADNTTATYTVTVTIAPSPAKAITAFSIVSPAAAGMIDEARKTILVNVPSGTDVSSLVASFSTTGAYVLVGSDVQESGVTSNNFTSSVIYTVTAADGSTQNYSVTVRAGALPASLALTVTAGSNGSGFKNISVASDGSVYAAGSISGTGTYNFGNNVSTAGTYTGSNIVLVKYDSSGLAQWARTVTAGSNNSQFNSVAVASDGSVYAAGYISGTETYDFGNNASTAGAYTYTGSNIILVKYNSSGVAQWARTVQYGGSNNSVYNGVSVASDGSVYAAGYISGTGNYYFSGSVIAAGTSVENMLLVKYSSSGVAQWARTVTAGSNVSTLYSVSAASDGSVYAAGRIIGTSVYDFGNSVTATGPYEFLNILLVKYNSAGVAQWARTVTAAGDDSLFYTVSVSTDGSVHAAGSIQRCSAYDFGNNVSATAAYCGAGNVILVKYNSSGAAQWARTVTSTSGASVYSSGYSGVSVASDGSVYAAGHIYDTGTYYFGPSVTATGPYQFDNILLVKYNSSGVAQWAQTVTVGSSDSSFNCVSVASDGSVYAAGTMSGTSTYEFGNSVTAAGTYIGSNILLVKYY